MNQVVILAHTILLYIPMKFKLNSKLVKRYRVNGKIMQGQIFLKVCNSELLFFFATHWHNEIHITVKFHENIPND